MNTSQACGIHTLSFQSLRNYSGRSLEAQTKIFVVYHFLLSCAVIVAVNLACVPKAFAQTVNVTFSAHVPSTCVFGTPTAGTLSVNGTGTAFNSADAASGSVHITCNQGATLTVGAPNYVGGEGFIFAGSDSTITVNSSDADNGLTATNHGDPLALTVAGSKLLIVNMSANSNGKIASGSHSFAVPLTVIP